jgi:hypothetical protein
MSFDTFWQCYPRRVAKLAAKKAYDKALKSATHEEIMAGVERYAYHTRTTEHQFIKHPASWLNAGCWEDELQDTRPMIPSRNMSNLDLLEMDLRERIANGSGSTSQGSLAFEPVPRLSGR